MRPLPAALIAAVLLLSACRHGDAQERLTGTLQVPVRVLGPDGIEQPREAANLLRYALALVPATLFGMADRATLRQLAADKTRIALITDELSIWAKAGARPWLPGADETLQITPADVRVARVMTAAFSPEGDSRLGVGFHDLAEDTNLILVYVDRACTVVGHHGAESKADDKTAAPAGNDAGASAGGHSVSSAVQVNLRFAAPGLYWVRTALDQPIAVVAPTSPALEVHTR